MSSEVQVRGKDGLVSLDISQEIARKELVRMLEDDGWVILKDVTGLDSSETARLHEYVLAILAMARGGKFDHSPPKHWAYSNLLNAPFIRSDNWQVLAQEKEIIAIDCYHLGGGQNIQWHWEYDRGLRGNALKETEVVEAHGHDLIIYNSWLAQRFPKPNKVVDMIMIKHRWSGFGWAGGLR